MTSATENTARLLGVWRLLSAQIRAEDTGEVLDLHGPDPRGFIVFGSEGRMTAIITSAGRTPPAGDAEAAALFRGMSAYTGRFRVEGDRVVTEVDVAWHPAWENTGQTRFLAFDEDRLMLTTGVQDHPSYPGRKLRGIVIWARDW